jgi:hypothetical protein
MYILVCMYVCMYVCKGWAKIHPALALRPLISIMLPLLVHPSTNSTFLMGRHCSHVIPRNTGRSNEILDKLLPRNHIGYLWLIHAGCFKKSFATLKSYINVFRGHVEYFGLS